MSSFGGSVNSRPMNDSHPTMMADMPKTDSLKSLELIPELVDPTDMKLMLSHSYGLMGQMRNNVVYVDEETVLYSVGAHLALHNKLTQSIQYLQGRNNVQEVIALCEGWSKDKPQCVAVVCCVTR